MNRMISLMSVAFLFSIVSAPARGQDDKAMQAVLDKAVKALGGEEKLRQTMSWKLTGDQSEPVNTVQGIERYRSVSEFEEEGKKITTTDILNGAKGWNISGGGQFELMKEGLAQVRQRAYQEVIPILVYPLKGKGFTVKSAGEEKVDGKPAIGVRATFPDKSESVLFFDKETGLPLKHTYKVQGYNDKTINVEDTFSNYKEIDGIKKAMKMKSKESNGKDETFDSVITEFKVLKEVDPKTFADPK
jgi:hypothetical protein